MDPYRSQYLHQFEEEMDCYNGVVLGMLMPGGAWKRLPRLLQSWLRNYIGGIAMYFISGFLWCFYIYWWKHNVYVPKEHIPKKRTMLLHIAASMQALPWYCALPAVSEYVVEKGWTRCFCTISEVGWQFYIASLAAYLILVEIGIYWSHRLLHDIKPLYKYLHAPHHKFNTPKTMSPFAGMALNPLDGILQAAPLVMAIFLVPVHFRTHVGLLFFEGVWSANIHDCIHGTVWPFMGAGYHTIHHTANRHNYGNYTVWMDWMFGTLRHPKEDDKAK